jgi:20S proteasome alpha/beta subunit
MKMKHNNLAKSGENSLVTPVLAYNPWRKLKPKKKPVSLIVGIICKDGIVLAADSQTTKGVAKQLGTNKISVAEFGNGHALMAESGSADLSNTAIEIFQRKAKGVKMEDESTVAKIAEESVREVVKGITAHLNPNSPDSERQSFLFEEVNYFELMVAYYFEGRPRLYKLNPAWCIPVPASSYFMTSGIAGDLVNYILLKHTKPGMDSKFAAVIAVKTILDAIDNIEGCGEPARVASIHKGLFPSVSTTLVSDANPSGTVIWQTLVKIFPPEEIQQLARIISTVESQLKTTQDQQIENALRLGTEKILEALYPTQSYPEDGGQSSQ